MTAPTRTRLVALLAFACALASQAAHAQTDTRWKPDAAAAQRGAELFGPACGFCHGKDARGGERGPDLLRSELVNRDDRGELVSDVLAHGRPDRGMPPFPDLAPKAADIASFLHERIGAVANRMAYQIADVLTGDARAGRVYFQKECKACHSPTGDLAGIGSRHAPDVLQALIAWPGPNVISFIGFDLRPVKRPPVAVSVTLPSGERIAGTAMFIGEFDIALRDGAGTYRSFRRDTLRGVEVKDPLAGHLALLPRYSDADLHNLTAYLAGLK